MSQFGSAPPPDPNDPSAQQPGQYGSSQFGSPGYSSGPPSGPPPNNYLVPAILTVFCCWPLAIPAIVFASQVNAKYASGDVAGANESAEKAKKFAIWAAIAGVTVTVLYLIFIFALGGLASMGSTA